MKITITQIPSTYKVSKWFKDSFPTNAKGSPLSYYYIFKCPIWEEL